MSIMRSIAAAGVVVGLSLAAAQAKAACTITGVTTQGQSFEQVNRYPLKSAHRQCYRAFLNAVRQFGLVEAQAHLGCGDRSGSGVVGSVHNGEATKHRTPGCSRF